MKTFKNFLTEHRQSLAGPDGDLIKHEGGHIDIHTNSPYSPRKQSIIDFYVPEEKRGKGIGKELVRQALEKHKDLGGQASSKESIGILHKFGFRHPSMPTGSVEDHIKKYKEDSSVYMALNDEHGKKYVGEK